MRYVPLVALKLQHPFYRDGNCPDFEIRLTASGQRVVERHRLIARPTRTGLTLITAVDRNGTPPVELSEDAPLGFELVLQNPDFVRFTDFSRYTDNSAPLFVNTNAPSGGELELGEFQASNSESLHVQKSSDHEHFVLAGRPRPGIKLASFTIENEEGHVRAYDSVSRTLTLDCSGVAAGARLVVRYPVTPALPRRVFAAVEVRGSGTAWLASKPAEYTITFARKQIRWTYYLVTDVDPGDFTIVDTTGDENKLVFSNENRRDLHLEPDPADPQAQALAATYPNARRIRFTSDTAVACSAHPRRGVELHLNGERLPFALPNPPLQNFMSCETIAQDPQRQESLFCVVKHLTTSLHPNG